MRVLSFLLMSLSIGCGGAHADLMDEFDEAGSPDSAIDDDASADDAAPEAAIEAALPETSLADAPRPDSGTSVADAAQVVCGSVVCAADEVCCANAAYAYQCVKGKSCPDGSGTIACDGPEDCPASAGSCCADVRLGAACSPSVGAAECRASCFNMGPTPCPGTVKLRRCRAKADCTQPGYTRCCLFESGGTSTELCSNDGIVSFAKSCK